MRDFQREIDAAFAGTAIDRDVLEELAQHAESTYAAWRADGIRAEDADARIAELIAGWRNDPASLRRAVKRATPVEAPPSSRSMFSGALADLIYGLRLLRAQRGAAAVTILTIALGVGAVTTLFSVANGVLLRPLSWSDTERIVQLVETRGGKQGRIPGTILNGSYLAWENEPQTIEGIGAYRDAQMTLNGVGEASRVPVIFVTPSLLELLKVQPLRGRLFTRGEGVPGQPSFLILSQSFWEQKFGGSDDAIGRIVQLDGVAHTIVGVMPRSFRFPTAEAQGWVPWVIPEVDAGNGGKRGVIMRTLARLRPGVTAAQAAAEGTARAIAAPDAGGMGLALFGARDPIQIAVVDAKEAATAEVRPAILVLLIASLLLFATAIANVANMQLARATARHREMTIRAALGANTSRLARQLLIETGITALIGTAGGLALTIALHAVLPAVLPAGFPRVDAIAIDGQVLGITIILALLTGLACGVLPLMHVRRLDLTRSLAEASAASAGAGRGRLALTRTLIAGSQVAVTCVLVIGAALLSRSFVTQMHADRGYDPANVLSAGIPFPGNYSVSQRADALNRLLDRLKQRPGVTHAAASTTLPLASAPFTFFTFPSPLRGGDKVGVEVIRRVVSPDYFGALNVRISSGRRLSDADTPAAPHVAVVNRAFVKKYLDDVPIDRAVGLSIGPNPWSQSKPAPALTIVGVADDLVQGPINAEPQPEIFVSSPQLPGTNLGSQWFVVLRTIGDPADYVEALKSALREEDPAIALEGVMTMDERVGLSVSSARTYALLLGGFAVFALVIAGTGLFGVLSFSVTQRSRELAVRSALGATRADVVAVAIRHTGVAIGAGLLIGVAAAFGLSINLSPFLYGVPANDWISFGIAPIVLLLVGVAACAVPARRVALTDPIQVLRES